MCSNWVGVRGLQGDKAVVVMSVAVFGVGLCLGNCLKWLECSVWILGWALWVHSRSR